MSIFTFLIASVKGKNDLPDINTEPSLGNFNSLLLRLYMYINNEIFDTDMLLYAVQ